ncbi:coil containing protein [Vibrio phage 1.206.O._10N.222.51.B10]|nr:coil containing protein [Vibrio phage 1.206.O._10N.222.51.B10]
MARLSITVDSKGVPKAEKELKSLGDQGKKTESSVVSFGKSASKAITDVGKAAGGLAAGIAVLAEKTLEYTKELNRNATAAGLSAKQFQSMSLATNTVGISMEQLGAILGDTEEKIGEFLTTGGGGFQDFADVMGMTADEAMNVASQFQHMSSREVLAEMVRQMEAAGVSSQKMNFALEGMASDARYLIPLLKDGASELNTLESNFSSLATTIDDETVANLNKLKTVSLVVANNMGNTLATALSDVSDDLYTAGENAAFFWASLQKGTQQQILSDMATVASHISQVNSEIERLESGESGVLIDAASALGVTSVDEQIDKRKARLLELKSTYEDLRDSYNNTFGFNSEPTDIGTITGGGVDGLISKEQELINAKVAGLQEQFLTEQEIIEKKIALVDAATISEGEKIALIDNLWDEHFNKQILGAQRAADAKKAIDEAERRNAEQDLRRRSQALNDFTGNLKDTLGEQNALYKATAIVNTTIATYESATQAYKALAGIPYVGPALGAAAAGAAVGAGLANVSAIQSARMQGGQVEAGKTYMVGERGPEPFTPSVSGRITPSHEAGQSTGTTVNIYNQAQGVSVQSEQNADGGTDVYVTREEFSGLMAAYGSDPDSDFNRTQDSLYSRPRS